ncbi:transposase [Streptococcus pneumoniae]|uniref:transposase n=1 Tax=Streptococcus pneumoniae TaxID=1313 RepID=UPI00099E1C52|nr:transposase [Streptococcus pneumoniae]
MLYVGIDVAKNKHDVTALNVRGKTVLKPLTFSNNKAGFELLDLSLRQLNQDCLIALKLLSDPNREQFQHDNRQVDLKILARHIHRLKKKQSDWKVQYTRCLDIIFPELDKIVGKHSEYTYQLLTRYPNPQKRIEAGFDKLIEIKRLTASKIQDILSVAPRSIGTTSPAREFEIIEIIKHYKRLIDKAETCVNDLMAEFNSVITTVTGIGGLQAFAGLDSSIYQSGQIDLAGRMIKRGSPHLRWALIQAAKACARFSPAFKAYLKTKLEQGKHYNVAIIHLAKKLIRTLFYILKKSCHLTNKK